jgi:hypothetical protein
LSEHPQIKRIDDWIATLEQKARTLLDGIEIDAEEMSPKERIDSAAKLMTLAQRYMVIRQQSEAAEPQGRNTILLTLMKQMRGEILPYSTSEPEASPERGVDGLHREITEPVSHTARLLDQPDGE